MLGRTILPSDEELGKKDDDHKPGASGKTTASWGLLKTPLRWRRRRMLLVVVALYLVYVFVKNIPDLGEQNGRTAAFRGIRTPGTLPTAPKPTDDPSDIEPTGSPPGFAALKAGAPTPRTYTGQVRFYRLASSLHAASHTQGYRTTNRNVLFAVSNLKSATTLIPMICEMARWSRNWVHAALMGREDIPLAELLEMNGYDKEKCPAIWHDARPDYTEWSTETRAEASVGAAMMHINSYLHPQVVITDDSLNEDAFFVRGIRTRAKAYSMPAIEVPKDRADNFMWITRLDAGSLRNWHHPTIDILIQAPAESSGGLLRLLKSIQQADYSGLRPPRLTIELPADIDPAVNRYLESFVWPPASTDNPLASSQLILRRRIAHQRATQEDSSVRFLELFYPASKKDSHVLLLSSQAQLSPLYFHYIKYILLEYRYSSYAETDAEDLMGISLHLPSKLLDGKTLLGYPKPEDMHTERYQENYPDLPNVPFLWEAPNSHAALYFGDKWTEFHSFLSNRVAKARLDTQKVAREKKVSETLPSWTEYMLELMQTRGYSLFYPATIAGESIVTVHNELFQLPEEFLPTPKKDDDTKDAGAEAPPMKEKEPFLVADAPPPAPQNLESERIPGSRPLHLALPFDADLPEIPHLPYLLTSGTLIHPSNTSFFAQNAANEFRTTVGGCTIPKGKHRILYKGETSDLFCFGDEADEWEDDHTALGDEDMASFVDDNVGRQAWEERVAEDAAKKRVSGGKKKGEKQKTVVLPSPVKLTPTVVELGQGNAPARVTAVAAPKPDLTM